MLDHLAEQGFLGTHQNKGYIRVADFQEMKQNLLERRRRVYSIDDLGRDCDSVTANTQRMMEALNSKESVSRFTNFGPHEIQKKIEEVTDTDFMSLYQPNMRVFIKTCNTEAAGEAVFPVRTSEEFRAEIDRLKEQIAKHGLNDLVVLQPEIQGQNKSFQVFLDPTNPDEIPVLALTDQLVAEDGKSYAGSISHEATRENLTKVGPAILDMVDNIRNKGPSTCGFLMCDYFECPDGNVVLFDPGLRPTGNTPAAMIKLWVKERIGKSVTTTSFFVVEFERRITYSEITRSLGKLADTEQILKTGFGVLPWGHNHVSGRAIFILVTPDVSDVREFGQRVREILAPLSNKRIFRSAQQIELDSKKGVGKSWQAT